MEIFSKCDEKWHLWYILSSLSPCPAHVSLTSSLYFSLSCHMSTKKVLFLILEPSPKSLLMIGQCTFSVQLSSIDSYWGLSLHSALRKNKAPTTVQSVNVVP